MYLQNNTTLQSGRYQIVRHISSGGFGNTYEGLHVMLDKRVAIKEFFVKDFCNRDETTAHVTTGIASKTALVNKLRKKFIDEARSLCKLEHPHIVHVYDVFEENGTAYYVMDFIDGPSLNDIVKKEGKLSEERALKYIRQVADALKYVHENNRLHLDIKPGNIMIDAHDNAYLIDFGASKQYDEESGENTSTLLGKTPGYAPLEQLGNDVVKFTPATDIYALGATLYKILSGITPPSATLLASGEELEPLPSSVSASVKDAVIKAMAINKKNRPQSSAEFLVLLESAPKAEPKKEEPKNIVEEDDERTIIAEGKITTSSNIDKVSEKQISQNSQQLESNKDTKNYEKATDSESKGKKKRKGGCCSVLILAFAAIFIAVLVLLVAIYLDAVNDSNQLSQQENTHETVLENNNDNSIEIYNQGYSYYENKEYSKAYDCFLNAANLGNADAQKAIGDMFYLGQGRSKDNTQAFKWWKKAADQGLAGACKDIGYLYEHGEGTPQNYESAVKYYRKAASKGFPEGQHQLGHMYYKGKGVEKDYSEAAKWFKKAANQNDANAQWILGYMYEFGQGVDINTTEAIKWYKKAAAQNVKEAKERLNILESAQNTSTAGATTTLKLGSHNGHGYVDLGLSVKWAICNVGANSPEDYGSYFAWGETRTKSEYNNSETYEKDMSWLRSNGYLDSRGNLSMEHDAARQNWGGSWRLPTKAECEELKNNCIWTWTTRGGKKGYEIKSRENGNSIFLPVAGRWSGGTLYDEGEYGYYWSSTPNERDIRATWDLWFNSSNRYVSSSYYYRFGGQVVRAVIE